MASPFQQKSRQRKILYTVCIIVLFTDGVVEAFNAAGQEFSDPRWVGVISGLPALNAQQTLQYLMKSVEDFVGATRQSDDITCLVLRCS